MNILRKTILPLFAAAATSIMLLGCGDETVLQDPGNISPNSGTVSQANFFIAFDPVDPAVIDLSTGGVDLSVEMTVTATVGDRNNQILTNPHTVYFETEWGLIDPFCTTVNGQCSVTWKPVGQLFPLDLETTIVGYTIGEEAFEDTNGNGVFNDGEFFYDVEEPWINVDGGFENFWVFDSGIDIIIDTVNGNDLTGINLVHDIADGFFNGPGCTHSSLCSVVLTATTVWDVASIPLTGDTVPTFSVGGTVSGLTGGILELQNNAGDDLSVTADGSFTFDTGLEDGDTYDVTVSVQPAGLVCTVSNGIGTINALLGSVTDVVVTCAPIPTFTVGGDITGTAIPAATTLVIQNNGGDDLTFDDTTPTAFTFPTAILDGASYSVTILTNTTGLTCTITGGGNGDGTGTISANVTNIDVNCI